MANKNIGIVGGGQLGRMLTQAAKPLGFKVIILETSADCPAASVADGQILGSFTNEAKIRELAEKSDFLTFETESANSTVLEELEKKGKIIHPSPKTLQIIKNKFGQKQFLRQAHIPVTDFVEVKLADDILKTAEVFGYPLVLKAKFDAYDGRGNALINNAGGVEPALQKLNGRELYVEKFVDFTKELSVVAARDIEGNITAYPVAETVHKNHICHTVTMPAKIPDAAQASAHKLAMQVLENLKGVGVFCIEMFLTQNDEILVNEIAPRVHNAGHLTIEGSKTSQFEQHIRAITGMQLGPVDLASPAAVMINILGGREGAANFPAFDGTLKDFSRQYSLGTGEISADYLDKTFIHIYGKIQTKPERKMGHITVLGNNTKDLLQTAEKIRALIKI